MRTRIVLAALAALLPLRVLADVPPPPETRILASGKLDATQSFEFSCNLVNKNEAGDILVTLTLKDAAGNTAVNPSTFQPATLTTTLMPSEAAMLVLPAGAVGVTSVYCWAEVPADATVFGTHQVRDAQARATAATPLAEDVNEAAGFLEALLEEILAKVDQLLNPPAPPRFEDCGNGTVADNENKLLWEKKTGQYSLGSAVICETAGCPDPHDVNNFYEWSDTGADPDGNAYTDFLAKLNDQTFGVAATPNDETGCFAKHCDWRLPTIVELQTIVDCSFGTPCIDPIFGPTAPFNYWSASSAASSTGAWVARFGTVGDPIVLIKGTESVVRAVRTGSCH